MPTQLVLRALLVDTTTELYGMEIGEAAGLMSGTVHPILARLEAVGWVESRWEDVDPQVAGCPTRRYYRITGAGVEQSRVELSRVLRPQPPPVDAGSKVAAKSPCPSSPQVLESLGSEISADITKAFRLSYIDASNVKVVPMSISTRYALLRSRTWAKS